MKSIFILIAAFFNLTLYSQRKDIDVKITFNDNHTENAKVKFRGNIFDENLLDMISISQKKITTVSSEGKNLKILAKDIQSLDFTDLKGKERHFVKMPDYDYLVELKYDGKKVKWYKLYGENMYDHSTYDQDYINKGKESLFLSILKNNRKKLKEFFADRPDLDADIEKINYNRLNEEDLIALLKKYDE